MKTKPTSTISVLFALILSGQIFVSAAWSQEKNENFNMQKRAEQRSLKRFTLKEWMDSKDHRALMDMWLSINTPSPYEFMFSGSFNQYSLESKQGAIAIATNKKSTEGSFSAYATLVGITTEYQNNVEENFNDVTGLFNVRVFGNTLQGTHITFHYGLRTRTSNNQLYRLNQSFPAVTLQLYMTKYFGVQGHYRYYLPTSESYYGDTQADELNTGVFIEYGMIRLFADWYQERQGSKLNSVDMGVLRTGSKVGFKVYF